MLQFQTRNDFIASLPTGMIMCEVGVFQGDFSKTLYHQSPLELHLIDIFSGYMCSGDKDGLNIKCTMMENEYDKLKKYFNKNNVFLHKGDGNEIMNKFPDEYFDFIYIDADHSYDSVLSNLNTALPKLKPFGILSGHDYNAQQFPGLVDAVNKFCKHNGLQIIIIANDMLPTFAIKKT
jgi:hypothetical protein